MTAPRALNFITACIAPLLTKSLFVKFFKRNYLFAKKILFVLVILRRVATKNLQ